MCELFKTPRRSLTFYFAWISMRSFSRLWQKRRWGTRLNQFSRVPQRAFARAYYRTHLLGCIRLYTNLYDFNASGTGGSGAWSSVSHDLTRSHTISHDLFRERMVICPIEARFPNPAPSLRASARGYFLFGNFAIRPE
jgi:hypothetical protein